MRVTALIIVLTALVFSQTKEDLGVVVQTADLGSANIARMSGDDVHFVGLFDSAVGGLNLQLFDVDIASGSSRIADTGFGGRGNVYGRAVSSQNHKLYFASLDPCYFYSYDATTGIIAQVVGFPAGQCGSVSSDKGIQVAVEGASGHLFFGTCVRGTVFQYDTNTSILTDYGLISAPVGNPTCTDCYRYVDTIQADATYVYVGMRDASTNDWWLTILTISDGTQTDCWKLTPETSGGVARRVSDQAIVYQHGSTWYLMPTDGTCPVTPISPAPTIYYSWVIQVGATGETHAMLFDPTYSATYFNVDVDLTAIDVSTATAGVTTFKYRNPAGSGDYITKTATVPMYDVGVGFATQQGATDNLLVMGGSYAPNVLRSIATNAKVDAGINGQSTHGIGWDGTYWYLSGYSASQHRYNPAAAWTVNGGTAATACSVGSPTNPCTATPSGFLKYGYWVAAGNDARVYTASRDERSGQDGGGISWYKASDYTSGTYRTGPPSLECFRPHHMIALALGASMAYSGQSVNNAGVSCSETVGKLFIFDTATHAITHTWTPHADAGSAGAIIELMNGHIMGVIHSHPTAADYTIYSIDPATGTMDWTVSGTGLAFDGGSVYDAGLSRGPDGFVYLYITHSLVRVNPADGAITTVYADSQGQIGSSVVTGPFGTALYLWGSTHLYRLRPWSPLAVSVKNNWPMATQIRVQYGDDEALGNTPVTAACAYGAACYVPITGHVIGTRKYRWQFLDAGNIVVAQSDIMDVVVN